MRLVRVGKYTINMEQVTEIIDYGDKLAVCFSAAWPNPTPEDGLGETHIASRNLTGADADAMRHYITQYADDAAAQIR
jgi:hypothetical protein